MSTTAHTAGTPGIAPVGNTVIRAGASKSAPKPSQGQKSQGGPDKPRSSKREIDLLEGRMNTLNTEGAALEARLAASPPHSEIADIGKRIKLINDELKTLEDQWLELSAKVEAAAV